MRNKDMNVEKWSRGDFGRRTITTQSFNDEGEITGEITETVPASVVLCDLCNYEFENDDFPVTVVNGSRAYCDECFGRIK